MQAYFYFYYPNKEQLMTNAVLAGLQTSDSQPVYVNRAVMDFLISHLPITGDMCTDEEKIVIVEGCLITLLKKDFATLKKFSTWFQNHLEDEDVKPQKDDPAIRTSIPALQRIFKKYLKVQEVSKSDMQSGDMGQINTVPTVWTPI